MWPRPRTKSMTPCCPCRWQSAWRWANRSRGDLRTQRLMDYMEKRMAGCVVAVDVGGTFTDIALADLDTGQLWTTKTPTTPHDQSQGFAAGVAKVLQQAGKAPGDVVATLHGSTVATNMI